MPRTAVAIPLLLAAGAVWLLSQSTTQTTLQDPPPGADRALLVTLGAGDREEVDWSGSVEVTGGELAELIGYELGYGDLVRPPRRWEAKTRPAFPFGRRPHDEGILDELPAGTYLAPRLYLYLRGSDGARVRLDTAEGAFEFRLDEIPPAGRREFLDGRVIVENSPLPILAGRGEPGSVTERLTDNDFASIALESDDVAWIAWTGFRDGADRVYAERISLADRRGSDREPHAVSPEGGDVYRTAVAKDGAGKIWVVWSERVDDNWDLYGRAFDGESWSEIERLTTAPQPDAQHKLAADSDGRLHLAWQGFRDGRAGVFYKSYDPSGGWSGETRLSEPDAANCWEPDLAMSDDGAVAVAWDQYGDDGYDIWLRRSHGDGWSEPQRLVGTARFEAYPSLTFDPQGRLWVAWHESGVNWGKDWGYPFDIRANAVGLYNSRRIRMGVLEGERLSSQPAGDLEDFLPPRGPGDNFYEYPELAADGDGRIWCFYRHRRPAQHNVYSRTPSHHALWEIFGSYYQGGEWSEPVLMPYSTGRNDMRIEAVRDSQGRLVAAWPTDRRNFRDFVNLIGDVFAARVPTPTGSSEQAELTEFRLPSVEPAPLAPQVPQREIAADEPVHPNEAQDVARVRDYVFELNGKRYKIYRGDMHRHTEISWDGYNDGPTEDTYRYALDAAALDYLAVTEHNFGVEDEYDWWRSQKFCDLYRVGDTFVPLFAYERSVPYPNGHRNVIFSYRGAPILDVQHYEWNTGQPNFGYTRQGPERFFAYLRKYKALAMPHTSGTSMGTDWADYDPEVEPVVEIYQSDRTSYECVDCWRAAPPDAPAEQHGGYRPDGFVSKAWEKGYRLGVQASSDHLGTHTAYAMLLAEENTREALVEAIRARRTYGATDNIIIDFRLIGDDREYVMGEDAEVSGPPRFKIHVEGTTPFSDVQIVKNNRRVLARQPNTEVADFEYRDSETPDAEEASFYYVRVRQNDRDQQIGWSSPIWVTSK